MEKVINNKRVQQLLSQDLASAMLDMQVLQAIPGYCEVGMSVSEKMINGYKLCYGGFIFSLADTAMAFACAEMDMDSVTANAQIEYLKPAHLYDQLIATAKVMQKNARHRYCDIEIKNQKNEVIAIMRGRQVMVELSKIDKAP